MRSLLLLVVTGAVLLVAQGGGPPQDPGLKPPQPPRDAELLPPVPEPPQTTIDRNDLIQRFAPETPLTGIWRLRRIAAGGREFVDELRGHLHVGRTHMSLVIIQSVGGRVLAQSGVRTYRIEDDNLVTTALIGFDNHQDQDQLRFEAFGFVERRRFLVTGATLRVEQGDGRFMEFERIE